jgi:hypothetical protein
VIDDKSGRGAEAARAEAVAVSVSRQEKDVDAISGRDDLALHSPASGLEGDWAPEPRLGIGEQLISGLSGDRLQLLCGSGWGWVSAQQATARRSGHCFGLSAGDVQQRDFRVAGQELCGLVDRGLPGVLDDPDERAHNGVRP